VNISTTFRAFCCVIDFVAATFAFQH
jgi:hypothetical protein